MMHILTGTFKHISTSPLFQPHFFGGWVTLLWNLFKVCHVLSSCFLVSPCPNRSSEVIAFFSLSWKYIPLYLVQRFTPLWRKCLYLGFLHISELFAICFYFVFAFQLLSFNSFHLSSSHFHIYFLSWCDLHLSFPQQTTTPQDFQITTSSANIIYLWKCIKVLINKVVLKRERHYHYF